MNLLATTPAKGAALAAAVGFIVIALFQVALASGAPLGRAAWGGAHARLPVGYRIGSAIAAVFWVFASLVILERGGVDVSPLPLDFVRWGAWILFGLLVLGALMNFVSRSRWERFLMAPLALILAVLCFLVARGGVPSGA